MAYYPCSVGHHAFPGKASSVYVAIGVGASMDRWKVRLCKKHAALVEELLEPCEINDDTPPLSEQEHFPCLTCGGPTLGGDRRMMFLTSYFANQDRRDFWTMFHTSCPCHPLLANTEITRALNDETRLEAARALHP